MLKRRFGVVTATCLVLGGLTVLAPSSASAAQAKTVKVKLLEYKVRPTPKSVEAGDVTFKVKNVGSIEHEFVVVRTDGAKLPVAADGSVDEDRISASAQVGEVEDVAPKKSGALKAKDLDPGSYTLFCNVVEESGGTTLVHYAQGMLTTFTVL